MSLTTGTIKELPYFPALLPDGVFVASFGNGSPQSLTSLASLRQRNVLATLRRLRAPSTSGIKLLVQADNYQPPDMDSGAVMKAPTPAGLANDPWRVTAANQLALSARNSSGAAASNWWATWLVEVQRPNAALIQQYPSVYGGEISADQEAAATAEDLANPLIGGLAPRPLEWILGNEYGSQVRRSVMLGKTISLPANAEPQLYVQATRSDPDEMLVLRGIVCDPGTGSDSLTITFSTDEGSFSYDVLAYPLGQVGLIPMMLQADRLIEVKASSTSAESIAIACQIDHVVRSDLVNARLGQSVPQPVHDAQEAGTL